MTTSEPLFQTLPEAPTFTAERYTVGLKPTLTEKNITNNSVNKIKLRNINHYSDLKKLILDKNII